MKERKVNLKFFVKFTEKHLCQSLFSKNRIPQSVSGRMSQSEKCKTKFLYTKKSLFCKNKSKKVIKPDL